MTLNNWTRITTNNDDTASWTWITTIGDDICQLD